MNLIIEYPKPNQTEHTMNNTEPSVAVVLGRIAERLIDVSCIILLSILGVKLATQIHINSLQHSWSQPSVMLMPAPTSDDSEQPPTRQLPVEIVRISAVNRNFF